MGLGHGGKGWVQILDAEANSLPLLGTSTANGWVQVAWSAYNNAVGTTYPTCGDLERDGVDELVLGLESFPGHGGWLEIKDDLLQMLSHHSWVQIHGDRDNQINGRTLPSVGR